MTLDMNQTTEKKGLNISAKSFVTAIVVKNLLVNAGDVGSVPGSGRALGGGNVNPLQSSCLENSMDSGAWRSTVHGIANTWTLSLCSAMT